MLQESACSILSYTNDNTYAFDADLNVVMSEPVDCTVKAFEWFKENHVKGNGEECHLLITTNKAMSINIKGKMISKSKKENSLGIKLHCYLSFKNDVTNLFKKASQKLHALSRVISYMDLDKLKCL